jgi:hypothetical protein
METTRIIVVLPCKFDWTPIVTDCPVPADEWATFGVERKEDEIFEVVHWKRFVDGITEMRTHALCEEVTEMRKKWPDAPVIMETRHPLDFAVVSAVRRRVPIYHVDGLSKTLHSDACRELGFYLKPDVPAGRFAQGYAEMFRKGTLLYTEVEQANHDYDPSRVGWFEYIASFLRK